VLGNQIWRITLDGVITETARGKGLAEDNFNLFVGRRCRWLYNDVGISPTRRSVFDYQKVTK
jgi:hypothetical protein